MKLRFERGLLLCEVQIAHAAQTLLLSRVLVDTGSAGTIFQTDELRKIGIEYDLNDEMHRIRGVGGSEFVFSKNLSLIQVGDLRTEHFMVEVGWMDYGFELQGILGLDFLRITKAIIDLDKFELRI